MLRCSAQQICHSPHMLNTVGLASIQAVPIVKCSGHESDAEMMSRNLCDMTEHDHRVAYTMCSQPSVKRYDATSHTHHAGMTVFPCLQLGEDTPGRNTWTMPSDPAVLLMQACQMCCASETIKHACNTKIMFLLATYRQSVSSLVYCWCRPVRCAAQAYIRRHVRLNTGPAAALHSPVPTACGKLLQGYVLSAGTLRAVEPLLQSV